MKMSQRYILLMSLVARYNRTDTLLLWRPDLPYHVNCCIELSMGAEEPCVVQKLYQRYEDGYLFVCIQFVNPDSVISGSFLY